MTPVFQTIVERGKGNCMQAAFASLFDMKLEDVPHFALSKTWFQDMYKFVEEQGYTYKGAIRNSKDFGNWGEDRMQTLSEYPGVGGYFFAAVYSPMFSDFNDYKTNGCPTTHAVIIDSVYNIIHDPNPAYQGRVVYPGHHHLEYNGVTEVYLIDKKS